MCVRVDVCACVSARVFFVCVCAKGCVLVNLGENMNVCVCVCVCVWVCVGVCGCVFVWVFWLI